MSSHTVHVLVVDDAIDYAEMVAELIRSVEGPSASVDVVTSYDAALDAFARTTYHVAFLDYALDSRDGLSLLREVRRRGIDTPVVVMTGRSAEEVAVDAMKAGACDYLGKTAVTPDAMGSALRHAIALGAQQQQRQQAEAALRANEERFRALVENSSDALFLIDRDARFVYLTPSTARQFGWNAEQMLGRPIFDFLHPDEHDYIRSRIADALQRPGEPVAAEARLRDGTGAWRRMEGVGVNRLDEPSVGAMVVNARDITERRQLEDQLRQAQKMEAVGRLAGGVAHDFNNLLTAILGYANLVLDELPFDNPLRVDLEEIRGAGERAASLTRQLLAFSRKQLLLPEVVNLNALVHQTTKAIRALIGDSVDMVTSLADDLLPVRVDPASFEQVLLNLAVNARDAMPNGGRLTIATANVDLDGNAVEARPPMMPGRYVSLTVGDTGAGMDAATRARVFEPFFTTKEQGKGIGLGLATVYGIVKQSGGYIWVYSEPGQGSAFKVYLPPTFASPGATSDDAGQEIRRGWETLLLVEQANTVRTARGEALRRRGYIVLEARDAAEALTLAARHPDPIHLLVATTDMPQMNGRELASRLLSARPELKVLLVAGSGAQDEHRSAVHEDRTATTGARQGPSDPDELAKRVRRILDSRSRADVLS